jgi:hypothetical protein
MRAACLLLVSIVLLAGVSAQQSDAEAQIVAQLRAYGVRLCIFLKNIYVKIHINFTARIPKMK